MPCSLATKSWGILLAGLLGASCIGIEPAVIETNDEPLTAGEPTDRMRLKIIGADGDPVAGAWVYWYMRGNPRFLCDPDSPPLQRGYVWSGKAQTNRDGIARLMTPPFNPKQPSFVVPFSVQVVGPDGQRALGSFMLSERSKSVELTPAVDLDIAFTCEGQPCEGLSGTIQITKEQASCVFPQLTVIVPKGRLEMAGVPRGTLSIDVRAARGTPQEVSATHKIELDTDISTTIDLLPEGAEPSNK